MAVVYLCEPFRTFNWTIDKDVEVDYIKSHVDSLGKTYDSFFRPGVGTIMTYKYREWSRTHTRCKDTCDVLWGGYEFQDGDHVLITARRFTGYSLPGAENRRKRAYNYAVVWKGYLLNHLEFFDLL